jgi:lysophospholipase L1-like esterase
MAEGNPWSAEREGLLRRLSALIGLLAALVLGELALRVHASLADPVRPGDLSRTAAAPAPPARGDCRDRHAQASMGDLLRPSVAPDVIYELKPGLETCFQGALVRTNEDALRAPRRFSRPKPAGVYRILLLGDSHTFGWALAYEDGWGARLERELSGKGGRVEVINTGVPGYNTGQEAAWLRAHGLSYQPDCVLVLFCGNDLGLPPFLQRPVSHLAARHSHLLGALVHFFALGTRGAESFDWYELPAEASLEDFVAAPDLRRIPPEYRHLVGVDGYRRALASIAESARRRGIPVVNFADYATTDVDWPEQVRFQEALGIIHEAPRIPWGDPAVSISRSDPHLNARGAALLADRVLAALRKRGVCIPPVS